MIDAGDNISSKKGGWEFDKNVVGTFDEHVSKSVPGYKVGHQIVCGLTDFFVSNGSKVYEIGCSTGSLISQIANTCVGKNDVEFLGLDVSEPMISKANEKFLDHMLPNNNIMKFELGDIIDYKLEKSSFIVCYYTVQFIHPSVRQQIIKKIYESLNWGGAFVMFEKVRGSDARFQDILTGLYHDYKMSNGYSSDEVVAKSQSLRGVMEPFSHQGNIDLLRRAGFNDIEVIFKEICFQGFLAIK